MLSKYCFLRSSRYRRKKPLGSSNIRVWGCYSVLLSSWLWKPRWFHHSSLSLSCNSCLVYFRVFPRWSSEQICCLFQIPVLRSSPCRWSRLDLHQFGKSFSVNPVIWDPKTWETEEHPPSDKPPTNTASNRRPENSVHEQLHEQEFSFVFILVSVCILLALLKITAACCRNVETHVWALFFNWGKVHKLPPTCFCRQKQRAPVPQQSVDIRCGSEAASPKLKLWYRLLLARALVHTRLHTLSCLLKTGFSSQKLEGWC